VFRRHGSQVAGVHQRVDVQQIQLIHLKAFETDIQHAHEVVILAGTDFAGQPQPFTPTLLEGLADPELTLALGSVAVASVDVRDAEIQRVIEGCHSLLFTVADETAAAAESEDGYLRSGLTEGAHRHPGSGDERSSDGANSRGAQKITSGNGHG